MGTQLAERYRGATDAEVRTLSAVERGMQDRDWVPTGEIPGLARLPGEDIDHALDALNDDELVERHRERHEGYRLTFDGYDLLALNALVESDAVVDLGGAVNEGKESVIYAARGESGDVVVKFHREGYSTFRDVDRTRAYADEKHHTSWIYRARKAAEREYDTIAQLHPEVSVPRPIAQNRHAVVLEHVDAKELSTVSVDHPITVLDAVVAQIAGAWQAGYVHADISEYNVLVAPDDVVLIDWPQAVERDHPHADELLERDLTNIRSYVARKYPSRDVPEVHDLVARVTGDG